MVGGLIDWYLLSEKSDLPFQIVNLLFSLRQAQLGHRLKKQSRHILHFL
jgi:hypothetical protein